MGSCYIGFDTGNYFVTLEGEKMKKKQSLFDTLKNLWWLWSILILVGGGLIAFGSEITNVLKTPEEIEQFKGEYYENQKEATKQFTEFSKQTSNFMASQEQYNDQNQNLVGLLTANLMRDDK